MEPVDIELGSLLQEPRRLLTRDLIGPTIYRLAQDRKTREAGQRVVTVVFRAAPRGRRRKLAFRVTWSCVVLAMKHGYAEVLEDLAKLARTKNEDVITELAALGLAFLLVTALLPRDQITKVVPKGGRGDFYLNGRRDQMIEISGTMEGDLSKRFSEKRQQILLNRRLTRAYVNVSRFATPASRLERVK